MKIKSKFMILIIIAIVALILAIGIGSVFIPVPDLLKIIGNNLLGFTYAIYPDDTLVSIFLKIRLPRALLAFIAGSALSVSGVIVQSILRNPLASSYTLGISSGAAVGASISILFGFTFLGSLTLPFFGLCFGLLTVVLAVGLANRIDKNMGNTTIILTGMAFSMFANAMISFFMTWSKEGAQRIIFWQLGSFSLKDWTHPTILFPVALIGIGIAMYFAKELDLMTFGEEQAKASGVSIYKIKWLLLSVAAVITGFTVSMVGIIGFVDLFTPHIARRIFGAKHKLVIPSAAIMGGTFMVLCDLVARTLTSPTELPVGAVTSAIGAPFFIYLYFERKAGKKHA
ncbi:MAG: FecCD family ABC transporter permease [Lachnospiraceae bacterium]